jgi:hypothetical protein
MALDGFWGDVFSRAAGPFKLRFILQPTMAAIFAIRSGLRDGKAGRPPYLWSIFNNPESRRALLHEGWKDIGKVFVAAIVVDVAYQWIVMKKIYLGEALCMAILLAIVPYLLIRGPVSRIARSAGARPSAPPVDTKKPT